MSACIHAIDQVLAIDTRHSFLRVGEGLLDAAREPRFREAIADAFDAVGDWLSNENRPAISPEQMAAWDCERRRDGGFGLLDGEAQPLESVVVSLYLRAKAVLGASSGKSLFGDLEGNLKKVRPALEKLSPETIGDLLVETERGANRDPGFLETLRAGAAELSAQLPYLESLEDRGRAVLKRRKPDECSCIVRGCNANGQCKNFCIGSWWTCLLIFLAIVLVIILG